MFDENDDCKCIKLAFSNLDLLLEARDYAKRNGLNTDDQGILLDFVMELYERIK